MNKQNDHQRLNCISPLQATVADENLMEERPR